MKNLSPFIIDRATEYHGDVRKLEAAIGAYAVGQVFGWRVLYLVHSQATCRRYEKVLGARFSDLCPEYTSQSRRCLGVRLVERIGSFWRVANKSEYTSERVLVGDDASAQGSLLD